MAALKENILQQLRGFIRPTKRSVSRIRKAGAIAVLLVMIPLLLEGISYIILKNVVHPTRLERFDDIYHREPTDYRWIPHPFLKYVQEEYINEKERLLNYISTEESHENTITIVALGGSTTRTGYPKYTEAFLNQQSKEVGLPYDFVVFNFGVDGWSSFQSIQNYFYLLKYLHPDYILVHHNHNEGEINRFFSRNGVEYYPEISSTERWLVSQSKTYKVLKLAYLLSYNRIRYKTDLRFYDILDQKEPYPSTARISAYLNDKDPEAFMPIFFERDFVDKQYPQEGITDEMLLSENYASLIRYAREDGGQVVIITQYQNYSKAAIDKFSSNADQLNKESRGLNSKLREISKEYNVLLVDIEAEMSPLDHLLVDEVHFKEEGIRAKGEIVGGAIWDDLLDAGSLARQQSRK